jgi:ParB family transcriptional regulator, chromosome partitioning protein
MARKNLLSSVTASMGSESMAHSDHEARSEYTRRGASRSMMQSLDELAESSLRMLDGETIVSLDPSVLDGSFVADRIGDGDEEYRQLLEAIRESGQASPILVRPHPDDVGRYMIVFGHRRARAARELGISVRAVIKPLTEIEHVVAQGQENTARANLTFIEKALFARKLLASGLARPTICTALTIDETLLSRMLAVAEGVPQVVLNAVGSAKGVGRDRWEELKKQVQNSTVADQAVGFVATKEFSEAPPVERFNLLLLHLQSFRRHRRVTRKPEEKAWALSGQAVRVETRDTGKAFTLTLRSGESSRFGSYLSANLDRFYQAFQESDGQERGD